MNRPVRFDERRPGFRFLLALGLLLLHLCFFWLLDRVRGVSSLAGTPAQGLRVEFVTRRPGPAPIRAHDPVASPPRAPVPSPPRRARRPDPAPSAAIKDLADGPGPEGESAPLVLDWRPQTREQAFPGVPGEPIGDAAQVPADAGRFRMRRQVSGKDVIEGTARALGLWPEGYSTDPCPRIERNIGQLMTDGRESGRRALDEELRRRQAACRR